MWLPSIITKPKRFTSKSSTLIDNIIYDFKPLSKSIGNVKSGSLIFDVADHLPIFHLFDFYIDVISNNVKPRYILKISYRINDNSLCKLSDVLSNTQWNDLTDIHDANTAYDTFHDKFSQIL